MRNFIKRFKCLDEKLTLIIGGLVLLIIFLICRRLVYILIVSGLIWLIISWYRNGLR